MSEYSKRHRAKIREYVASFKVGKSCLYCGESHPACLDFHHRDPSEKSFEVGAAHENNRSRESILREVAKCDIVCRNCHAKLHWGENLR